MQAFRYNWCNIILQHISYPNLIELILLFLGNKMSKRMIAHNEKQAINDNRV